MHIVNLLLLAINSVKKFLELDYMEYSTDALAQAAYVTNGGDSINQSNPNYALTNTELGDVGGGEYRSAQSFKLVGNVTMTAVEVRGGDAKTGTPSGDWTLRIETDNGSDKPSGTLANVNASIVVTPPATNTIVKSSFATPFDLVAGTTYWLVVLCDNQTTNNYWNLSYNSGTFSVNYARSADSGATWYQTRSDLQLYFKIYTKSLQSYSEATIKTQGSYALKAVAAITDSLNKTLTHTFDPALDLSGVSTLKLDMRASRTGANVKLGLHNTTNSQATGGTITTDGAYTVHTFTSSGTFHTNRAGSVNQLVIGGGGGGAGRWGGGGGAGGYVEETNKAVTQGDLTVTIGNGGAGGAPENSGVAGQNSYFNGATAAGGGYGAAGAVTGTGGNGGCGGGGAQYGTPTGGTGSQGGNGGVCPSGLYNGGGGGGAGGNGGNANPAGGTGGIGTASSITGSSVGRAGGGGGSQYGTSSGSATSGGGTGNGTAGTDGTGGGGGAGHTDGVSGGKGGSGIVIIRYLTSSQSLTTELTPTIAQADTFQEGITWDISAVADADKNAINQIKFTIMDAVAANTFYIDKIRYG